MKAAHDTTQSRRGGIWSPPHPADSSPDLPGVHIWLAVLDRIRADPGVLSAEERRKADEFSQAEMQQRYLATRTFCRQVLSRYAGIAPERLELALAANGKPYLPGDDPLQFNLSHSGPLGLLAVCRDRAVGIDLEPVRARPNLLAIARRVLDQAIVEGLTALSDERERIEYFTRSWTGFEARQKLTGNGIFGPRTAPPHRIYPFAPQPGWLAALAVEGETDPPLHFFEFQPHFLAQRRQGTP
ncbi:MAG: hypothetical protein KJ558_09965 [Gammaproteobacteria bacterium]|nr:hypothetical protein [Gammaproteobacteria bacterium]MBU1655131.1 hypothetical protein [Gammaproteobacteria bacterium]MBU1962097.1 hypothetical protein [Gammaproteobacteria bacterium]